MSQVAQAASNDEPDKEAIMALYIKGWTPQELADRFNLHVRRVHKWVVRGGWAKLKAEGRQNSQSHEEDIQRVSRLRHGITEEQERDLAVLRAKKPTNMEEAKEREELIHLMAKSIDTLHPQQTNHITAISVHMLSTAQVVREPQAIDVPSSTVPVPPEQVEGRP